MTDGSSAGQSRKPRFLTRSGCAVIQAPTGTCLASIADFMSSFPGVKSVTASQESGVVAVRLGMGVRSFGEDVEITVAAQGEDSFVCVSSTPVVKRTLIDYGKNRHNIRRILAELIDAHGGHLVDATGSRKT